MKGRDTSTKFTSTHEAISSAKVGSFYHAWYVYNILIKTCAANNEN